MASLELEARLDNLLATGQKETADIDILTPITEREECPICMIPLPLREDEIEFKICCGKRICIGCSYKQKLNDNKNGVPKSEQKCAFCCQLSPTNHIKAMKKLMKKNNSNAFIQMANHYKTGDGVMQSNTRALEMYIRAAELGDTRAFGMIGQYYFMTQNTSKAVEFWAVSAKKGSYYAHSLLASLDDMNGNADGCVEHLKVAANAGHKVSMDYLMDNYKRKFVSKEDLTQTLRTYQASSNEMKSKDRDDARAFLK